MCEVRDIDFEVFQYQITPKTVAQMEAIKDIDFGVLGALDNGRIVELN